MNGDSSPTAEFTGITFAGATQDPRHGLQVIINGSNNSANGTKSKDGGVNTFRSTVRWTQGRKRSRGVLVPVSDAG